LVIKNGNILDNADLTPAIARGQAYLGYVSVKSGNSGWNNSDSTFLGADYFDSSSGTQGTINTTDSTAGYNFVDNFYMLKPTDESSGDTTHDPDGYTSPSNAFDNNDSTTALLSTVNTDPVNNSLGKTFAAKYVDGAYIKLGMENSGGSMTYTAKLQSYDGASWNDVATLLSESVSDQTERTVTTYYPIEATIQGLRVNFNTAGQGTSTTTLNNLYTLEYGVYTSPATVHTDTILTVTSAPDNLLVYASGTVLAAHTMTLDVSEDGGTTFSITGESVESYIDTTSFGSGTGIALKFNLTTSGSTSPTLNGYGLYILDDS